MAAHDRLRLYLQRYFIFGGVILFAGLIFAFVFTPAEAGDQPQETEHYCLSCHNDPDLSVQLPDGETLSLYIPPEKIEHSVHSQQGIECEACHTEIKTYPHPEIEYNSARELSRQLLFILPQVPLRQL